MSSSDRPSRQEAGEVESTGGETAHGETLVADDPAELATLGAELLARAIDEAVRRRGRARVALSGGTTPGPMLKELAGLALPWERVDWFQVDERAVPPDHERSNFRGIVQALGEVGRAGTLFRMEAEREDRLAAAAAYGALLRRSFGVARAVELDAMVLGVGDDGHTASLFPGTEAVAIEDRLVAAVDAPDGLEPRLTLTAPVIREARLALVLVRGAGKREAVRAARAGGDLDAVPARIIGACTGRVVWLLDPEAAGP